MSWVSLALMLLKIASDLVIWARERELISEGYDKAIAEVSHSIFLKTTAGKAIWEKVSKMSDPEVDAALRELEPVDRPK